MRITQYNLLSPPLATPKHFPECEVAALNPEVRWAAIRQKLISEVGQLSIICLQEISQDWASRLTTFFHSNNYTFIFRLYGQRFNGYMGVGIAFPDNFYTLEECQLVQVNDELPFPDAKPTESPTILTHSWWGSWYHWFWQNMSWTQSKIQTVEDHWKKARQKWNTMVWLRLRDHSTERSFCVATYHMPCDFRRPTVMMIHSALAMQTAQKLSEENPLVFAGDWNFKPDSPFYGLLTTGSLGDFRPQISPTSLDRSVWNPELLNPMTSAYAEALGVEPPYTNYALTEWAKEPFIGTLDYLFLTPNAWNIKKIEILPMAEDPEDVWETPLPTLDEPSDHLLLAVDLELS